MPIVADRHDGLDRIEHPVEHRRLDANRHVVCGDEFLRGDVRRVDLQV